MGGEAQGNERRGRESAGREAMPPITIIFHHPNYIVECAAAAATVACTH